MKRIKEACMLQTLVFIPDPSYPLDEALAKVEAEYKNYKANVDPNKVIIVSDKKNNDGSYEIKVKKTVSGYEAGEYFDK